MEIDPVAKMVETLRLKNNEFAQVCRKLANEIQIIQLKVLSIGGKTEPMLMDRSHG